MYSAMTVSDQQLFFLIAVYFLSIIVDLVEYSNMIMSDQRSFLLIEIYF